LYPSRSRRAVDRDRRTNSSARALARRSINGRQDGADRALHGLAEPRNQLRRRRCGDQLCFPLTCWRTWARRLAAVTRHRSELLASGADARQGCEARRSAAAPCGRE
jgi:hypothetical protein